VAVEPIGVAALATGMAVSRCMLTPPPSPKLAVSNLHHRHRAERSSTGRSDVSGTITGSHMTGSHMTGIDDGIECVYAFAADRG
jgi:hypothetical protein